MKRRRKKGEHKGNNKHNIKKIILYADHFWYLEHSIRKEKEKKGIKVIRVFFFFWVWFSCIF
jgi:hypothetical protein